MADKKGPTPLSEIFTQKSPDKEESASDEKESTGSESSEKEEKEEEKEEDQKSEDESSEDDEDSSRADHSEEDEESEEDESEEEDKSEKTSKDEKSDDKKKDDADKKKVDEKKEDKSSDDKSKWESEENPYFKRFKDTSANWNREHQENLQLKNQLTQVVEQNEVLKKIADGTYDPEKDDPAKKTRPEDVATAALNAGKGLASRAAAVREFGQEKVNEALTEFDKVFGENEIIQAVVMGSESPVYEAINVLDRFHFENKYGSRPKDIYENIRKEVEAELEPKLRAKISKELIDRSDKKKNTPSTPFSSGRGSNGLDKSKNSEGTKPIPLGKIFPKL